MNFAVRKLTRRMTGFKAVQKIKGNSKRIKNCKKNCVSIHGGMGQSAND